MPASILRLYVGHMSLHQILSAAGIKLHTGASLSHFNFPPPPPGSFLRRFPATKILYRLDVDGDELAVLKTVPWEKVKVDVVSVRTSPGVVQYLLENAAYRHAYTEQGFAYFEHKANQAQGPG